MLVGSSQIAIDLIEKYSRIVIFHHIRPDGDCLGSQLGLKRLIELNYKNKEVYIVGDSKDSFPFLNLQHDSVEDLDLSNALAIIVDVNNIERIESSYLFEKHKFAEILRIDHHPNDDSWEQAQRWIDSSFVACAEQISQLAIDAKWAIDSECAKPLYLGIYTDSGRFLYKQTTARTHRIAATLIDTGLDFNQIHQELNKKSKADLDLESFVLSKKQTYKNVIYYVMDLNQQKELKLNSQSATRPNLLANIGSYKIWLSFVQEENKKWRVEFRSSGPNVREVATKWGGGGHLNASGAIIDDPSKISLIVQDCQKAIEDFN
ncbi:DHH family phosphoesterase [Mesomycoplasma bovoculi]|uniref:DHHA1 domain-containing protein 2 n=1 Tax=Mesomycoplasma bovoculi M165/69 TaxID=743966 RepID=W5UZR3_9BACT|nr:bifunctional oligoribonuclease/PAP phosphatase NrnA [Mesomycoplasma bovoculi]AHH45023.1 DHHA1 domain-containing protein 2 [Mesomycoplasma bovoculi M165/69]